MSHPSSVKERTRVGTPVSAKSSAQTQEVRGRFTKVLFRNEESGSTIALFRTFASPSGMVAEEDGESEGQLLRVRGKFTAEDLESREITLWGRVREGRRGRFFYVTDGGVWRGLSPGSEEPSKKSIIRFCTESFRGRRFGPVAAQKLVDALGEHAWKALTREPHLLAEVVGEERSLELFGVVQGITVSRATRLAHLLGMGLSWSYAQRALGALGTSAVERVRADPYCLIGIQGVQFSTADRLAQKGFSIQPSDPRRLRALCVSVLAEAAGEGHTSMARGDVISRVADLGGLAALGISAEELLDRTIREKSLSTDMGDIYLPRLLAAEKQAAEHLARLLMRPARSFKFDFDQDLELSLYSVEQREAIRQGLCSPVVLINGRPGSGKTTVACEIVRLAHRFGIPVTLSATTGNAADRLSEAMSEGGLGGQKIVVEPAQTIQSIAGNKSPGNALPRGIVVIDEAGMMDLPLFARVLANAGDNTSVVLLGDPDQLPPVVAGAASRDVKDSSVVPVVELTTVRRQGENTLIAINGDRIRKGLTPLFYGQPLYPNILGQTGVKTRVTDIEMNSYFREAQDPLVGASKVVDTVRRLIASEGAEMRDVQVYSPMRRGYMGTHNLNRMLQELHNPSGEAIKTITTLRFPLVRKGSKSAPATSASPKKGGRGARGAGPAPWPLEVGAELVGASRGKAATSARKRMRVLELPADGSVVVEKADGEIQVFSAAEKESLSVVYDLTLRVGDPVVHLRNDKKGRNLVNGMRGVVSKATEEGGAVVDFYEGRQVHYTKAQLSELALAYATTVHKGQGQQQPFSVLALHHSEHIVMLERGLLLVGMTRAQQKVVLVGTHLALRMALRNARGIERRTRLAERAALRLSQIEAAKQGRPSAPKERKILVENWEVQEESLPTARQSVILQATGWGVQDDLFAPESVDSPTPTPSVGGRMSR